MQSQTLFLQPIVDPIPNPNPNFSNAKGVASFSNYSQKPSGTLTTTQGKTLVKGGVATAIIQAGSVFNTDTTFSSLFSDITGIGLDGSFAGSAKSEMQVIANFKVGAKKTFSFDFIADLALTAKEIENSATEYNQAKGKIGFLVLDTTNTNKPKVLDYFGIQGKLISSEQIADLKYSKSSNVTIESKSRPQTTDLKYSKSSNVTIESKSRPQTTDIDGNNGEDSLKAKTIGSYQKTFKDNTNITIVQMNASNITFLGDTLINNLGKDVIYGTIGKDNLEGTESGDKIYSSLGDDKLNGGKGNDILEGGQGNDILNGGRGNDKLYGSWGDDVLIGGSGNDVLVGGNGYDKFVFKRGLDKILNCCDSLLKSEFDVIKDFKVGIDKIEFDGWGDINAKTWLNKMFDQGKISDTKDGLLFNLDAGDTQSTLLVSGVKYNQIKSESIIFS